MVHFSRKTFVFVLVILIGIISSGINNIYAKNGLNNNINLSQKYNGKKLDRIKSSIKGKKDYRFLISSNETLDSIKAFFVAREEKAKVKQYGENTFMVRLPLKSQFLTEDLGLIDKGILPIKIGNYDVIAPEIVEGLTSETLPQASETSPQLSPQGEGVEGFLLGEEVGKLWGNNLIGAGVFQEGLASKVKIKVAVLDTGIDYNHADLDANYDSIISYDFVNEDNDAIDDNGHGTQVAGIIGAEVNGEGIYGVNSNTDLISLKVLDASGLGTTYDILEAIEYAKLNNVKVLNMSFGGVGTIQNNAVCEAITDAKANGIITVVSAGNNNSNISNTIPAGCTDSITVGAIDSENNKASFSNYGTGVIYAPGVDIYSTGLNNSYFSKSGTSFSAPFVSGLVAKELAYNNIISYSDLINNIKNNYNLIKNTQLNITPDTFTPTSSGSTLSGTTVPPVDYSTYKYYSGSFLHNGEIYGNSLYDTKTNNFSSSDLSKVKIYTYQEYQKLSQTTEGTFTALSVPTDGLIGSWDLNGNANDSSGNNNNGVASNVIWENTNGLNKVGSFNGSNSIITVPNNSLLNTTKLSISFFYKPTSVKDNAGIIGKWQYQPNSGGENQWVVYQNADGKIRFTINTGNITEIASNKLVNNTNHTYHIVATYDGVNMKIFIDNQEDVSIAKTGNIISGSQRIEIGGYASTIGFLNTFSNSKIGAMKIYNKALSVQDINALYYDGQEKILGITGIAPLPIGRWDLNGNTLDSSGYNHNGIASNVTWVDSGMLNGTQAASFNGVNSGIYTNSFLALNENSSFSMTTTVKVGQIGKTQRIMGTYENIQDRFYTDIYLLNTGKIATYVVKQNIIGNSAISNQTYELGKTYNITMTYDGINIRLYINGILDGSGLRTFSNSLSNVLPLYLGYHPYYGNSTLKMQGNISRSKIFNKALNSNEVYNLYLDGNQTVDNNISTNQPIDPTSKILSNPTATHDFIDFSSNVSLVNQNFIKSTDLIGKVNEKNGGDPVTISKGEFTYDNTLMSIPGVKIPYEFDISYKNQTYYNGPVGVNWDHNYNMYLSEEANGNVFFYNGKLGIFRFIKNGTIFDTNLGLRAKLVNNSGVYSIEYENGDTYTFNATNKKISKLEDRYGNNLTFTYTNDLLSKVTDTLGRDIIYNYYDHNRLKEVVDFNGRKVEFIYYDGITTNGSIYDLKTIKINNSVDAIKTINFEYTTGGDDYSNHNITKLIDSKGQTYVENTYNAGDRVDTQKFGNGTISYGYNLDANNNVTKNTVTDKLGNITEYNYDSNHNNTSAIYYNETQASSATYNYEYNADGYIIKETRPRGNGYTYIYDTKGNVIEKRFKADVTQDNNSSDLVTTYTYNSLNQILTTTNPNGVIETNVIDTNGNITSKTISGVKTHSGTTYDIVNNYTYLNDGLVDTTLDGEGNTINFNYNSSGQVKEIVKGTGTNSYTGSFTYNDYGNILSSTDGEGNNKTFTYNDFNGVSSGITAEGITTSYQYDLNNNKTKQTVYLTGGIEVNTYFYYDLLDNMTSSLTDTGNGTTLLTTYKYDDNNNLIEKQEGNGAPVKYNYNAFGKIKEERIVMLDTDNSKDIVTTYTYDSNGNLVSKTDALGKITVYVYDLYDRLIREIKPNGTYSEYGYNKDQTISSKSLFSSSATILLKTNYFYDGLGKIVNEIKYLDPENTLGAVFTKKVYDKNGKEINIIDSKGNTTTNNYDNLGRINYSLDALGNKVQYSYDNRDLVISKSVIPNTGTGIITIASLYDNDGRLISETNNLNKTKSLAYNNLNQIISKTDEENNKTDYTLNYLGKILTQTQYVGGNPITTNYSYDERGNVISVSDPESNETKYEFDKINRNTKVIYPDNSELLYKYDKNSNLISQSDPNGTMVNNTYDNINLLTNRDITTGSGVIGTSSESYSYDDLGRLINTSSGEEGVATSFNYDNLSRLSSETSSGGIVGYEYDSNNNLSKIIHPDLKETTYSYDELNRNTSVSFSGETIATYNFTGIVNDSITYGNGKQIIYDYDDLLRLSSLNNGVKTYNYTYDNANNITSDSFKNYNYDNIYRVTGVNDIVSGTTIESFGYDNVGNRTTDLNTEYTTNDLNQYTTLSGTTLSGSLSYDNNGNITNNGKYSFEYDYKNRLIKVNSGTTLVTEFTYDTLGRRIQKKTQEETINYLYADKNILEEHKSFGTRNLKKVYINGLGTDNLIAYDNEEISLTHAEKQELLFCENRVLPYISDFTKYSWNTLVNRCNELSFGGTATITNRYYFHKNHLGSIVGLTNAIGNVVLEYDYDVFGNTYIKDGSGSLVNIDTYEGELYDNNRLYTGREYDNEIGLYYLRARYYDAKLGRFISRDPIGQVDDVNLYAYVGNNGVMFFDPSGLSSKNAIPNNYFILDDVALKMLYVFKVGVETEPLYNKMVELELKNENRNNYLIIIDDYNATINSGYIKAPQEMNIYHTWGNGNEGNIKLISPDKHQEIIFDKNLNPVKDPINGATYNYGTSIIDHFVEDVIPYYIWGNPGNDTTSVGSRLMKNFDLIPIYFNK